MHFISWEDMREALYKYDLVQKNVCAEFIQKEAIFNEKSNNTKPISIKLFYEKVLTDNFVVSAADGGSKSTKLSRIIAPNQQ